MALGPSGRPNEPIGVIWMALALLAAAIIGAALDAGAIEIWTDVDGMKTTDPKICPDALRIKSIGFDEAAELAYADKLQVTARAPDHLVHAEVIVEDGALMAAGAADRNPISQLRLQVGVITQPQVAEKGRFERHMARAQPFARAARRDVGLELKRELNQFAIEQQALGADDDVANRGSSRRHSGCG